MDPDMGPKQLQNKVQFDIRYYFCWRGSENIYEMTKDTSQLAYDRETKIAYVFKCRDEMTQNHQETNNPIVTGFMPQILNPDGMVNRLCPVHSYENYLNHLNKKNKFLWQTPNQAAFDKGQHIWYKMIELVKILWEHSWEI